jgi:hypothetical protein
LKACRHSPNCSTIHSRSQLLPKTYFIQLK